MKQLQSLGGVYFIYLFLYSGLEFTITFLTHHKFGFSSMQQGWMFFCIGITMAILQGSWVRRVPPNGTKKMATRVSYVGLCQLYTINFEFWSRGDSSQYNVIIHYNFMDLCWRVAWLEFICKNHGISIFKIFRAHWTSAEQT